MACAVASVATVITVETPSTGAASAATAAWSAASTTMSMASGDSACAAYTHLAVEALSLPSRCSATIRTLDMGKTSCGAGFNPTSESVGAADGGSGPALQEDLLLQCGNQFGRVLNHHAAAALGRRGVVGGRERVAPALAQVGGGDRLQRMELEPPQ